MIEKIRYFFSRTVWETDLSSLPWYRRPLFRLGRIVQLTLTGIREDELTLRASGLTYVTLMTLAPLLAFVFVVYRGMGRGREMIEQIQTFTADMPEQVQTFMQTLLDYVQGTSTVGLGGMAGFVLVYAVIKVMGNIEHAFNRVWGIRSSRTLMRKVTDYVSILVLVPMLIMAGGALKGFQATTFWVNQPEAIHAMYWRFLRVMPMFMVWTAFCVLYLFMSTGRARVKSVLPAALVTALTWMAWQKFYVASQSWLFAGENTDKIFGAFAAVPIFMVWLFISWTIVLIGAELTYAIQNHMVHGLDRAARQASPESRARLAVSIVYALGESMTDRGPPFKVQDYAAKHRLTERLVNDVLDILMEAGLVGRLENDPGGGAVLLRAPDQVTVKDAMDSVLRHGADPATLGLVGLSTPVESVWAGVESGLNTTAGQTSVRDLLEEAGPEPEDVPPPAEGQEPEGVPEDEPGDEPNGDLDDEPEGAPEDEPAETVPDPEEDRVRSDLLRDAAPLDDPEWPPQGDPVAETPSDDPEEDDSEAETGEGIPEDEKREPEDGPGPVDILTGGS